MTPRAQALTDWARTYLAMEGEGAHGRAYTRERLEAFAKQHGFVGTDIERAVDNAIRAAAKEAAAV